MKRIYLDHAAITPVSPEVLEEMSCFSSAEYGNPSSIHAEGVAAKKAVDAARKKIADILHGHIDELIFTGSGTEANNLAITGVEEAMAISEHLHLGRPHFIASVIEHPSVLETMHWLEKKGARVDYVGVDEKGIVDTEELKKKIRLDTVLVSIMYVNNEIGTIQPIWEVAKMVRAARKANNSVFPYLHVDASQAPEYISIDLRSFGADLVTFDGQKIYGPRGIGMLWVRRGVALKPLIHGGSQEHDLRSGTENVAAICGLAKAFEMATGADAMRVSVLRDYFIEGMQKIPALVAAGLTVNGSVDEGERIANNVNISLPALDTEFLLLQLDAHGISCSTKSSCLRDEDESYVVRALAKDASGKGKNSKKIATAASHSLRFSLGRATTKKDIDKTLKTIAQLAFLH